MSHLITQAMLKKILPQITQRFAGIQDVLSDLGLSVDEPLRALQNGHPREATICTGICLENLLRRMWQHYNPDVEPERDQLGTFIYGLNQKIDNPAIYQYMHAIRLTRNRASHVVDTIYEDDALDCLAKFFAIAQWYGVTKLGYRSNMDVTQSGVKSDRAEEFVLKEYSPSYHNERFEIQVISLLQQAQAGELQSVIRDMNNLQDQFGFRMLEDDVLANAIRLNTYRREILISPYLDMIEALRAEKMRYTDRILVFVENYLVGTVYRNLFAGRRSESCVGVVTTHDVEGVVMPRGTLGAYFAYMMGKTAIDCMNPELKHHNDRERSFCVYDHKVNKSGIVDSMGANALCDECRKTILHSDNPMTADQFAALDKLFEYSGQLLATPKEGNKNAPV